AREQALDHRLDAAGGVFAGRDQVADDEPASVLERAAELELREHPVEAVGRLVQVFEEHDAVLEGGLQRRAAKRCEGREVAAAERAFGAATARGLRGPGEAAGLVPEE